MHFASTKRPYFHFWSKIWRHYRVPRPRFPQGRENFVDSRTFKANIRLLIFAWSFRTSWHKMGFLGQNRGRGGAILIPTNSFLLLEVLTSVPILVKIDEEMRPRECSLLGDGHTATLTDWQTDANRFYNLSHAICCSYSYGTDNKIAGFKYIESHQPNGTILPAPMLICNFCVTTLVCKLRNTSHLATHYVHLDKIDWLIE